MFIDDERLSQIMALSTHELNAMLERYTLIREALNGDGGFAPVVIRDSAGKPTGVKRTHLVQYPRESEQKFARRNEVAWYENAILPACQRFVGYLAKKPPIRSLPHPLLEEFAADCNWRGDAIDVFWQSFMVEAKARGCMLLIVDMPNTEIPANEADQIDHRFFPYLVPLAPELVASFELDQRGRLSRLEYHDTMDGDPIIRGWDASSWWVTKGDTTIESGTHGLGVCPVLAFSENGTFPHVGTFGQIADMSKRLFNARSELDEILRSQTFSLLTYQVPPEQSHSFDPAKTAEAIGTHNMLIHGGNQPGFIAPSDGPAKTYLEVIKHIEEAIKRVSLAVDIANSQSTESGLALKIRFESLNAALTGFARRMEDLERNVWSLVSRWLGLNAAGECEWSKDYALADIAAELQTLADMIASGMPAEAIAQQKKTVVQLAFPALPQDDMQALLSAIDESGKEINTENQP